MSSGFACVSSSAPVKFRSLVVYTAAFLHVPWPTIWDFLQSLVLPETARIPGRISQLNNPADLGMRERVPEDGETGIDACVPIRLCVEVSSAQCALTQSTFIGKVLKGRHNLDAPQT